MLPSCATDSVDEDVGGKEARGGRGSATGAFMNVLLQRGARPQALARRLQTTSAYVPQASLRDVESGPRAPKRLKPTSPTFYTGRPGFHDGLAHLQDAAHHAQSALKSLSLLPLPAFAAAALPPREPVWKTRAEMGGAFAGKLSMTRYRRALAALTTLDEYRNLAATAHVPELADSIAGVLAMFEKENKAAVLARGKRKPVAFDQFGRTYTVGRRKTSSARVWMIPVKAPTPTALAEPVPEPEAPPAEQGILGMGREDQPATAAPTAPKVEVNPSTILINNVPLAQYFPISADRERVVRPLKVAGLLGAYNIFALVRGGGTSGQSGAVTQGVAKGLAAQELALGRPEVALMMKKCSFYLSTTSFVCLPGHVQRNSAVVILVWSSVRRLVSRRPVPE
jgi:small subunit ribosomal protein S9